LLKSHVLQAEHLAEHVGANIVEHLAEHESADIAEHELCMAQIHAEHHIHTYKLRQGVWQCLGGSSHSFLKITNFPSSGSFQELAGFLEFFFHILENFPGYIVFIIFSQLHLCSNAFLNFSNSSFKFTFASITFTKQKDKV
jgi:hypothetical protein